jgi:hypothetical protein
LPRRCRKWFLTFDPPPNGGALAGTPRQTASLTLNSKGGERCRFYERPGIRLLGRRSLPGSRGIDVTRRAGCVKPPDTGCCPPSLCLVSRTIRPKKDRPSEPFGANAASRDRPTYADVDQTSCFSDEVDRRGLRRVANLGSAGDRTLSCVFVSKSSVSCARANWLEVWLTMRPRFTARPLSEITPIVRPEAQQNPSDPVISESYQGLGMI